MALALSRDLPRFAAIALALATVPLLWAPWLHVEEEPLCILQDPCPDGEAYDERGYQTSGSIVAAFSVLSAAFLLAPRAAGLAGRWAATVLLALAALVARLPDFPAVRVFASVDERWGGVVAFLCCLAAAALAAGSAWADRSARTAASA